MRVVMCLPGAPFHFIFVTYRGDHICYVCNQRNRAKNEVIEHFQNCIKVSRGFDCLKRKLEQNTTIYF